MLIKALERTNGMIFGYERTGENKRKRERMRGIEERIEEIGIEIKGGEGTGKRNRNRK